MASSFDSRFWGLRGSTSTSTLATTTTLATMATLATTLEFWPKLFTRLVTNDAPSKDFQACFLVDHCDLVELKSG